jgi:hypothetical protein
MERTASIYRPSAICQKGAWRFIEGFYGKSAWRFFHKRAGRIVFALLDYEACGFFASFPAQAKAMSNPK